jgi:hypothetical protein
VQILGRAHEGSGPSAHRVAHGAEVSASLRSEKQQNLLRALRDSYVNSLFADLLIPGLRLEEPIVWRGVNRAAQKRHDQHIPRTFFFRKVGMYPHAVADGQRSDRTDGQGFAITGDLGLDTGPIKIECRAPLCVG